MKRILLLVLSIVALVSALVLGTTTVMAHGEPGSQTWYLDGYGGKADGSRQMIRDTNSTFLGGEADIYSGLDMVWVANQAE